MGKKEKKAKVESITELDPNDPVHPMLARFQHAEVNPNFAGSTAELNRMFGAAVFQSEGGGAPSNTLRNKQNEMKAAKRKQVVALQSDELTYIGTRGFDNPTSLSNQEELMKTYVALKYGKKLRLFEVSPITLSPNLEGHSQIAAEESRDTGIEKTQEEKREAAADLVKAFGSKKKRITYERREKNKIDANVMQQSIDTAVDQLEMPDAEPEIKDESVLTLIPPCNRQATSAQDVYRLDDILLESELNAIMTDTVEQFLDADTADIRAWREAKKYSDYFLAMLTKLQSKKRDPRVLRTAAIAVYTECLIIFLKLKHEAIRKKYIDIPKEFPLWMHEKVTDSFTTLNANGTRNRSEACKDKTCCYIMVLVLLANDFHFDVQLMSTSLNVHINKLLMLAKAVGITIVYNPNSKEHRGMLKLPLPKPINRRGRKKPLRAR